MIKVENKRKYKGLGVYVGRPSSLGNPFKLESESERAVVIARYRKWLNEQPVTSRAKKELTRLIGEYKKTGRLTLICWCSPKACHADVIAEAIMRGAKE